MLVPFLTLCSEICPLTTGNLLQVQQSLDKSRERSEVQIIELSIDPDRDTQARLAAYAHLTGASWELVTESDPKLASISAFFGFSHFRVPEDTPPSLDWLTHQPLTYDVDHSTGYVLIGKRGTEVFSTGASPDFHGTLNPTLHQFLSAQGLHNLNDPSRQSWTPDSALASLGWLLKTALPPAES